VLHHATLEVPKDRWNDCIGFWGLLGFAPMQPPVPLRGRFTWVARGGTQVHLADVGTPIVAEVGHIAVLVPDYAGSITALREAGYEVNPGSNAWDAERVFVRDPVGHLIEIMSAPPVGPFTD
jgi:catechol 2,3-dioxygenase-like lactoylglutathione lyase family enzyme